MVNYTKNRWNNYDDSKTFSENLENDAILTLEKANHMEQVLVDFDFLISEMENACFYSDEIFGGEI